MGSFVTDLLCPRVVLGVGNLLVVPSSCQSLALELIPHLSFRVPRASPSSQFPSRLRGTFLCRRLAGGLAPGDAPSPLPLSPLAGRAKAQ